MFAAQMLAAAHICIMDSMAVVHVAAQIDRALLICAFEFIEFGNLAHARCSDLVPRVFVREAKMKVCILRFP